MGAHLYPLIAEIMITGSCFAPGVRNSEIVAVKRSILEDMRGASLPPKYIASNFGDLLILLHYCITAMAT